MRCPVCKAENTEVPLCRRCKADLSLLFQLEAQRERCCAQARRCLQQGQWVDVVRFASEADGLRNVNESVRLAALGYLLAGDFEQALRHYRLARAH
jgi:hypothetical protein